MTVEELMTPSPATCGPADNMAQAVERMWDANCGIIPVVDDAGRVLGVLTDRDICIAAGTRGVAPGDLGVQEMPQTRIACCRPDDDVRTALAIMRRHRVRRLPVTTDEGVLHGILSFDDVALAAGPRSGVTATDVVATMKAICAPPLPVARSAA